MAQSKKSSTAKKSSTKKSTAAPVGVPNEPKKAGISDDDMEALAAAAETAGAEKINPKIGHPTEAKRGGVTKADIQVLTGDEVEGPKRDKPGPAPSLTGAVGDGVGVPTEAKRGGLNKLERKLQGAK